MWWSARVLGFGAMLTLGVGGEARAEKAMASPAVPATSAAARSPDAGDEDDATGDAADDVAIERRAVTVLPLTPRGTVSTRQARGVTAQVRTAVDALVREAAARLLPSTKADDGVLRRCADTDACYEDVARVRGADRLARGAVAAVEGGLQVTLVVAPSHARFSATLDGSVADAARLDRLVREAFAEDTLRGSVVVLGQPGDVVEVDGRRRGAVPTQGGLVVERLREGQRALRVTRPESKNGTAYDPFTRDVDVRHGEQVELKVVLLPVVSTAALAEGAAASTANAGGPPLAAMVSLASGGALLLGGAVCGMFSLLDSLAVEQRADRQLVFPRDEELVTRGTTLAVVADVLYGVGVAAAAGGVALWMTSTPNAEEAR